MIYNDRYPTASELVPGVDITAAVHTISTSFDTLMDPYYIGYIPFELFPKNWCINTHDITPDTITITQLKQNVPFGFCYQTADYSQLYYKDAGGTCRKYNNNSDCYFINKMCIADLTYVDYIRLNVMIIAAPTDKVIDDGAFSFGTPNNTTYDFKRQDFTVTIDISTLDAFINHNGTITINGVIINGQSENITLSYSDFTNAIAYKTTATHTIRAQIYNVAIGRSSKYKNGSTAANIVPFIGIDCPAGSVPEQRYMALLFEWQSYYTLTYDNLGNFGSLSVGMDVSGYSIGRYQTDHIYRDEIVELAGQLEYSTLLNKNGWYRHQYFEYSGGNSFRLYPSIDVTDIWNIISLINKIEIGATSAASITATDTYYDTQSTALYTDSNATTQNRATDNYVPDLLYQLQPWQQPNIDITANEFKNDDVPPYDPTPGGDEFGDMYGQCGPNAGSSGSVTNFVTPWVLTSAQLADFGAHLWTDLLDFDAQGQPIAGGLWQNAKIAVDTYFATGSFDPASVMDFILSVRYFPINLQKAEYSTQFSVPAVYFGTGRVGVDVTTQPWIANNLGIFISGGSFDLAAWGHKYHDWRDVGNAQAEIYIPFCGTYPLPWTEVKDKTLELSYHIDIISGAMTVYVEVTNGFDRDLVVVGSGLVGFEVPITATSANRLNAAILSDLGGMTGMIADPNQVATAVTGANASALAESKMIGPGPHAMADVDDGTSIDTNTFGGIKPTLTNALGSPMNPLGGLQMAKAAAPIALGISQRPGVSATVMPGGRGWGALCGKRIPFIKVHKGRYPEDSRYGHTLGHPVFQSKSIGSCSGYTQCMQVDTSGLPCTSVERNMIKSILESGFYA